VLELFLQLIDVLRLKVTNQTDRSHPSLRILLDLQFPIASLPNVNLPWCKWLANANH
jgi:hypothetical protein